MSAPGTGISVLPATSLPVADDRLIWNHNSGRIPIRVDVIDDDTRTIVPISDAQVDVIGTTSLEVKNKTLGAVTWSVWVYFEIASAAKNEVAASDIQVNN